MPVATPRPFVAPGDYEAVSTACLRKRMRERPYIEVVFDIFEGPFTDGVVLASGVPAFYNFPPPGSAMGSNSKLAHLYRVYGAKAGEPINASDLVRKAWRVRLVSVGQESATRYSKVVEVLERLA